MVKLVLGELAPFFTVKASNRPNYSFSQTAGDYRVLTFIAGSQHPIERRLLDALAAVPGYCGDGQTVFVVSADPEDEQPGRIGLPDGTITFFDGDRRVADRFGISYEAGKPVSILLSPRLQLIGIVQSGTPEQQIETIVNALKQQPPVERINVFGDAPALIIPYVFDRALCKELIASHKQDGGAPSGFMVEDNGRTVVRHDAARKVRRDVLLKEPRVVDAVRASIVRRLVPQVALAFQFHGTHLERYVVSCYDAAEGGHFSGHRDNTTTGTAHRRFAVTINLNSEEYEGGELVFPEFGPRRYKPPTGAAVVFSCSLLHRAMPVSRGLRYAFLPFLHDDAAETVRLANAASIDHGSTQLP